MAFNGDGPNEDALAFKNRTGVDRDEHLAHMQELIDISNSIGFGPSQSKDGIRPSVIAPFNLFQMIRSVKRFGMDIKDVYKSNNYGMRSDDFIRHADGDKSHMLFSGCSVTFGDGVLLEHLWAYKLYEKLSESERLSGYYNLARNGATVTEILSQVLKYIELFGVPGRIIINLPENTRDAENGLFATQGLANQEILSLYDSLEKICDEHGSSLIIFSWDETRASRLDYVLASKKYFYTFKKRDRALHIFDFCDSNKDDKYSEFFLYAMDMVHPGIPEQDFYFNFALDIIRRGNDKKN